MKDHVKLRKFVTYFHFTSWDYVGFGIRIDWRSPNIKIYLPFCFLRIGYIVHTVRFGPYFDLGGFREDDNDD